LENRKPERASIKLLWKMAVPNLLGALKAVQKSTAGKVARGERIEAAVSCPDRSLVLRCKGQPTW